MSEEFDRKKKEFLESHPNIKEEGIDWLMLSMWYNWYPELKHFERLHHFCGIGMFLSMMIAMISMIVVVYKTNIYNHPTDFICNVFAPIIMTICLICLGLFIAFGVVRLIVDQKGKKIVEEWMK